MLVRKMRSEDIVAVAEIERECFSQPWSEKSFEDSISRDDTIFLVCEETQNSHAVEVQNTAEEKFLDGQITGYIGMYISFDEVSITNVAVSPKFRKQGIGKLLVSKAKLEAKEAKAETIFLEVRVSNTPAISLYEKMGFENLGVRKNFYDHPKEDAYIMRCDLV